MLVRRAVHEPTPALDDQSLHEHDVGDLPDVLPLGGRLEEGLVRACQESRGVVAEQRLAGPTDEPIVGAVVDQKHALRGQDWRRAGFDHSRVEPARTPGQHRTIQRLGPGDQIRRVGDPVWSRASLASAISTQSGTPDAWRRYRWGWFTLSPAHASG